ncbi:hypothetical protein LCGC14_1025050 [marine sediment metagenome]|uniref:Uncharacterized protein n=1 Tax=marine sediment metagenome TaxID=412755 RepID=A0A0F9MW88_9ZZZZ
MNNEYFVRQGILRILEYEEIRYCSDYKPGTLMEAILEPGNVIHTHDGNVFVNNVLAARFELRVSDTQIIDRITNGGDSLCEILENWISNELVDFRKLMVKFIRSERGKDE